MASWGCPTVPLEVGPLGDPARLPCPRTAPPLFEGYLDQPSSELVSFAHTMCIFDEDVVKTLDFCIKQASSLNVSTTFSDVVPEFHKSVPGSPNVAARDLRSRVLRSVQGTAHWKVSPSSTVFPSVSTESIPEDFDRITHQMIVEKETMQGLTNYEHVLHDAVYRRFTVFDPDTEEWSEEWRRRARQAGLVPFELNDSTRGFWWKQKQVFIPMTACYLNGYLDAPSHHLTSLAHSFGVDDEDVIRTVNFCVGKVSEESWFTIKTDVIPKFRRFLSKYSYVSAWDNRLKLIHSMRDGVQWRLGLPSSVYPYVPTEAIIDRYLATPIRRKWMSVRWHQQQEIVEVVRRVCALAALSVDLCELGNMLPIETAVAWVLELNERLYGSPSPSDLTLADYLEKYPDTVVYHFTNQLPCVAQFSSAWQAERERQGDLLRLVYEMVDKVASYEEIGRSIEGAVSEQKSVNHENYSRMDNERRVELHRAGITYDSVERPVSLHPMPLSPLSGFEGLRPTLECECALLNGLTAEFSRREPTALEFLLTSAPTTLSRQEDSKVTNIALKDAETAQNCVNTKVITTVTIEDDDVEIIEVVPVGLTSKKKKKAWVKRRREQEQAAKRNAAKARAHVQAVKMRQVNVESKPGKLTKKAEAEKIAWESAMGRTNANPGPVPLPSAPSNLPLPLHVPPKEEFGHEAWQPVVYEGEWIVDDMRYRRFEVPVSEEDRETQKAWRRRALRAGIAPYALKKTDPRREKTAMSTPDPRCTRRPARLPELYTPPSGQEAKYPLEYEEDDEAAVSRTIEFMLATASATPSKESNFSPINEALNQLHVVYNDYNMHHLKRLLIDLRDSLREGVRWRLGVPPGVVIRVPSLRLIQNWLSVSSTRSAQSPGMRRARGALLRDTVEADLLDAKAVLLNLLQMVCEYDSPTEPRNGTIMQASVMELNERLYGSTYLDSSAPNITEVTARSPDTDIVSFPASFPCVLHWGHTEIVRLRTHGEVSRLLFEAVERLSSMVDNKTDQLRLLLNQRRVNWENWKILPFSMRDELFASGLKQIPPCPDAPRTPLKAPAPVSSLAAQEVSVDEDEVLFVCEVRSTTSEELGKEVAKNKPVHLTKQKMIGASVSSVMEKETTKKKMNRRHLEILESEANRVKKQLEDARKRISQFDGNEGSAAPSKKSRWDESQTSGDANSGDSRPKDGMKEAEVPESVSPSSSYKEFLEAEKMRTKAYIDLMYGPPKPKPTREEVMRTNAAQKAAAMTNRLTVKLSRPSTSSQLPVGLLARGPALGPSNAPTVAYPDYMAHMGVPAPFRLPDMNVPPPGFFSQPPPTLPGTSLGAPGSFYRPSPVPGGLPPSPFPPLPPVPPPSDIHQLPVPASALGSAAPTTHVPSVVCSRSADSHASISHPLTEIPVPTSTPVPAHHPALNPQQPPAAVIPIARDPNELVEVVNSDSLRGKRSPSVITLDSETSSESEADIWEDVWTSEKELLKRQKAEEKLKRRNQREQVRAKRRRLEEEAERKRRDKEDEAKRRAIAEEKKRAAERIAKLEEELRIKKILLERKVEATKRKEDAYQKRVEEEQARRKEIERKLREQEERVIQSMHREAMLAEQRRRQEEEEQKRRMQSAPALLLHEQMAERISSVYDVDHSGRSLLPFGGERHNAGTEAAADEYEEEDEFLED